MQIKELEDFFVAGGVVAWPLLVFSLIVIALATERAFFWVRTNSRQVRVIRSVLSLYRDDPLDCLRLLRKNPHFPLARIFLEALELKAVPPEVFRIALESAAQSELPKLKRFNSVFETVITVAPLLGLMGTIIGLIRSFQALQLNDLSSANTSAITGGISEALFSTVMGLTVAIVTLFFFNLFRGFYRSQFAVIQEYSGQLELLYRLKHEAGEHIIEEPEEEPQTEEDGEFAKEQDYAPDVEAPPENFREENEEAVAEEGEEQNYAST